MLLENLLGWLFILFLTGLVTLAAVSKKSTDYYNDKDKNNDIEGQ